jgi:hypothetical protein
MKALLFEPSSPFNLKPIEIVDWRRIDHDYIKRNDGALIHAAYVFPMEAESYLKAIKFAFEEAQKAENLATKALYELRNKVSRGEIK